MPLTARLHGDRVEAPSLDDDGWRRVRQAGDALVCPECDQRMIGKRPANRIAHFAHFRRTTACSWGVGESADHLALKWELTRHIRTVTGWTAQMEVAAADRSWRADVLAEGPEGRRGSRTAAGLITDEAGNATIRLR